MERRRRPFEEFGPTWPLRGPRSIPQQRRWRAPREALEGAAAVFRPFAASIAPQKALGLSHHRVGEKKPRKGARERGGTFRLRLRRSVVVSAAFSIINILTWIINLLDTLSGVPSARTSEATKVADKKRRGTIIFRNHIVIVKQWGHRTAEK